MYKSILKLTTAGVLITALLAVVVITQGCDNNTQQPAQTTLQGSENSTPGFFLPLDPEATGNRCDETTLQTAPSATQQKPVERPKEPEPTEKPTIGQIIQDFFENLFGGGTAPEEETTQPTTAPVTKPATTQPVVTAPTTRPTEPESTTQPAAPGSNVTYQNYLDMTDDEKETFQNSFAEDEDESILLFRDWLKKAKKEHEADSISATIGTGPIDIGDLLKP